MHCILSFDNACRLTTRTQDRQFFRPGDRQQPRYTRLYNIIIMLPNATVIRLIKSFFLGPRAEFQYGHRAYAINSPGGRKMTCNSFSMSVLVSYRSRRIVLRTDHVIFYTRKPAVCSNDVCHFSHVLIHTHTHTFTNTHVRVRVQIRA